MNFCLLHCLDGGTTVTDAQGATRTSHTFEIHHEEVKVKSIQSGPCPDCSGQTQNHTYDANGNMASKTYDAAHRLTAIQDSAGNTIPYTLDPLGNRICSYRGGVEKATIAYRAEFDGLRAIAVLAVVLYHAGIGPGAGLVGVDVSVRACRYRYSAGIGRNRLSGSDAWG